MGCSHSAVEEVEVHGALPENLIKQHESDINEVYEIQAQLGAGTFGWVSAARHRATQRMVAVKCIAIPAASKNGSRIALFEDLRNEIKIMKTLHHPNIVNLYETYHEDTKLYMVMQLCKGGEVLDWRQAKGRSEQEICAVLGKVLSAIAYSEYSLHFTARRPALHYSISPHETTPYPYLRNAARP
jgi:serine/threonine protein kinase